MENNIKYLTAEEHEEAHFGDRKAIDATIIHNIRIMGAEMEYMVRQQTRGYMAVCVVSAVLGAVSTLISLAVLMGWM